MIGEHLLHCQATTKIQGDKTTRLTKYYRQRFGASASKFRQ